MATAQPSARKASGILHLHPGQTAENHPKSSKAKLQPEGEKVVVRRLPPGLTEDEFVAILGGDWKVGGGRVSWFSFQAGKISQDPSKPSRPARAYFQVLRPEASAALSDAVRAATWEDEAESWNSPSLVGPPVAEYSIYKKIPSSRRRSDGRQGTIDQDQEFMDFLEALANPSAGRDGTNDAGDEEFKGGKASSTPLIDYLREKKANKAKETAAAKAAKHARHESQGVKGKGASTEDGKKKSKESRGDKMGDKPRETVKVLTKKAAADAAEAAKTVASQITASKEDGQKSRRAGIQAAARQLQRDLGLSPGSAHRRARQNARAESDAKAGAGKDGGAGASATPQSPTTPARLSSSTAPKVPAASQPSSARASRSKKTTSTAESAKGKQVAEKAESGPSVPTKILLKKRDEPAGGSPAATETAPTTSTPAAAAPTGPKAREAKAGPSTGAKKGGATTLTPGATRGFVKHANPSQGVTEPLLREAMEAFGPVTFVEIDRRKGFAYVDFAEHSGLAKAVAASPLSVAQAAVQVLERKDREPKKPAPAVASAAPASNGAGSSTTAAQPPTGPAADKVAATELKRSSRRRGRGRGEGSSKETGGAAAAAAGTGAEHVAPSTAKAAAAGASGG